MRRMEVNHPHSLIWAWLVFWMSDMGFGESQITRRRHRGIVSLMENLKEGAESGIVDATASVFFQVFFFAQKIFVFLFG